MKFSKRIEWFYFSMDLESFYKSIWLGPFLLTWCAPFGYPQSFSLSFNPD